MCGVAGFISKEPRNLLEYQEVLDEIGIRGKHSTGVAWLDNVTGEIKTKIEQVPYDEFSIPDESTTCAIFHTRYSTSNIDFPQPVHNSELAVAHNGVITQLEFKHWKSIFGYGGTYRCDSVLLLDPPAHPLEAFEDSSMAVLELRKDRLEFYRNGQRPLYMMGDEDSVLVASTKKAVGSSAQMCVPGRSYSVSLTTGLKKKQIKDFKDWQI